MRSLMRISLVVVAISGVALVPAFADQHGPHAAVPVTARAHPAATAPPAKSAVPHAPVSVPQKIAANAALAARLEPLIPSGMTAATAATGFKNQGQFIAALHVAHNLNIPFAKLKAEMTGAEHDSLGQAIHDLQPGVNARAAVRTAGQQARMDTKATRPAKADSGAADRDGK